MKYSGRAQFQTALADAVAGTVLILLIGINALNLIFGWLPFGVFFLYTLLAVACVGGVTGLVALWVRVWRKAARRFET